MVSFNFASGAVPPGALYYQIDCGPSVAVGSTICVTGSPHYLTFCKPGNNANTYKVTSIPKPVFPHDDSARIACTRKLTILGLSQSSVTWTSVYPGALGTYNSYMSMSDSTHLSYTPAAGAPAYIDYKICGSPLANLCGYVNVCDTVRVYNFSALAETVSPTAPSFCTGGGGVAITAAASGGAAPYSYTWKNSSGTTVGTSATYTASVAGTYSVVVTDALYNSTLCPAFVKTVSVVAGMVPVVNAGPDQIVCASSPLTHLNGSVTYATGGVWTGGAGSFSAGSTSIITDYTPTSGELAAGTVDLILTSSGAGGGCTNKSDTVHIAYSPIVNVSMTANPVVCNGGSSGSATVAASGGWPPFTYSWNTSPVQTTPTATGLIAGTYTVVVTDAHNCTATSSATITQPTALTAIGTTLANVSCNGGNNGSASVTPTGGTAPYTYSWNTSPAQTTATATGLTAGTYTATVTDAHNCTTTATATVTQPTSLGATASTLTNVACNGGNNGSASVTPTGGTIPYTYSWSTSPVQTTATATGLVAGTYTVTVTDAHSCTTTATATVTQPSSLSASASTLTNVACFGGNNGSASATPGGGTSPYTYSWSSSPVQTTATATGLTAGIYTVTVTDAHSCTATAAATITQPSLLTAAGSTLTNVACNGGNNGSANATPGGGTPPYTYSWSTSPAQTTATATGLAAGTYTVTVTDAHNCSTTATATITEPTSLSATASTLTDVSCNGGNNGSASVTPTGGTTPYTYSWNTSPVKTTATATGLTAGTYTVTVTDAHSCATTATATVAQPTSLSATASTLTNVDCHGGNNGSASVTPTGGTSPYTYSWNTSPVQTTATAAGLIAGTYTATVTDAHNCTTTATATITQPTSLSATASTLTNVSCNGGSNGSASVAPTGGTAPYTYSWSTSPVQTTTSATGLTAGTYTVTVTDGHNCTVTATATITQPTLLSATASTLTNVSCNGGSNGSASVTPTGGTSPYTYSWSTSPVKTTATATGLTAGTYTATITDAHSCSVTATATITEPTSLSAAASTLTDVSCNGGNNGSVSVTPAGGTTPYTYSWNTSPLKTTATATGLAAGTYTVTVTDAHGCTTTATATVAQPTSLTATASTLTDVDCHGNNSGSASVTPAGGTAPYTYSWNTSPAQTTATSTGLIAGTYTVTVTDAHNCTTTATAAITQPTTLNATTSTLANVSCNGGSNGSASVTPTGGTAPYTYAWSTSPAQTTATATGLAAGTYTVVVTDAHNCTKTVTATVTQPTSLTASAATISNTSCSGVNNGSVSVTPTGGTSPYTYSWSTAPVQTTATATGLAAGTYTATVTDAHGCTTTATATVTQPSSLAATASTLTDVSCNGGSNGSVTVVVSGGTTPYTYSWGTSPVQTTATATGLVAGTYVVTVTDAHNCSVTAGTVVAQPTSLTATASTLTNVSCNGGSNGSVSVTPTGGTSPYTYSWSTSPVQTIATATGLTIGTYTVTVTDAHNCATTATTTIAQPSGLSATTTPRAMVSCYGSSDGAADVTAAGGSSPYTYSWSTSPVQTTIIANGLAAGTYTVTVTDAHNCTTTATVTITQPSVLNATASTLAHVSCNGGSNGSASATPVGGTAPYTYSWNTSPVQTTATATGLAAGTYTATITDAHNCTATATATVTEPTSLTATTATLTNVSCNGGNNGSVSVTPSGGTAPYTYSWNTSPTQNSATATGLTAGTYTVTVTDEHNCTTTATATITQPTVLTATAATQTDVSCNGGNNGSINVTPVGGTASYTYSWSTSPAQTTATASGLPAGTYTVMVTDAHNCTTTATATVAEPTSLGATASTLINVSCNGGGNGSASVAPTGGTAPYTYSWSTSPVQTTATATGLTAGTYTVTVTDAHNCTTTATAAVTEPTSLTASTATISNTACNGANNGSVNVTPTGGTSPYTYSWSTTPAQTTAAATGLAAGSYTATVTDAHGCTTTATAIVTQPSTLEATASTLTNVSCNGGNNGSVTVAASGGTTPYTYSWSTTPVQTTATATGLTAGTYIVTVTDAHNCTMTVGATVTEPMTLAITASTLTNVTCNSGNDGSVTVAPTGGTTPYTYSWSSLPAQTTATATGLVAGTYTVTVTDAHNCTTTGTATVTQPTMLEATAHTISNALCNGLNTGSVSVDPAGGTLPYTYSWSTSPTQTTATASGLPAGIYTVIVTDAHNCTTTANTTVTQPSSLAATASTLTDVACNGGNNGSVTVEPTGGSTPYTYSWNTTPAQMTATATGLTAGTYIATVTDAHNCSVTTSTTVAEPTALAAVASTATNVACNSGSDGSVSVAPTGGTVPYTYSWNTLPMQTTDTAVGLVARTYTVTVTDAHSCAVTAIATVSEPTVLTLAASTLTNVACNGGNDGSASATPDGGTLPYSYSWSTTPTQTTSGANGLTAGTYTVTVTDAHGCVAAAATTISEPTALIATASTLIRVSCNGGSNGSTLVVPDGGTAPYTYSWSTTPPQTDATATGLIAGTYTATVTDAHGCTITAATTVSEATTLTAAASTLTNVSCNANADGSVAVLADGGTVPYTYSWSTSPTQATSTATGLTAGIYTVTVTDSLGCHAISTTEVTQPTVLTATASVITNVSCNAGSNGSTTVTADGGTVPYTYSWSTTPIQTDATATGLPAGTYTATITDAHNCVATATTTVTEPTVLQASVSSGDILCNRGTTMTTVTAVGGTTPYNGVGTFTVSAGSYSYTVTDSNGCTSITSVTVSQPDSISLSGTSTDVSCDAANNGTATILASGGTTPYTYQWDANANNQTTPTATGLTKGPFNITVADKNGCAKTATILVNGEVSSMTLASQVSSPNCVSNNTGSISTAVTGGIPPYTYTWSNGNTGTNITDAPSGNYTVTVTDSVGCSTSGTYTINQPAPLQVTLVPQIYPSGFNISGNGASDGSVKTEVAGGMATYTYLWSNGTSSHDLVDVPAGEYTVTVTDEHGCLDTASVTLKGPDVLELPTGFSPNGDGRNDLFVIHGINAYPNNQLVIFNRWGNEVYSADGYNNTWNGKNKEGKDLPDGTYFVVLTINGGAITRNGYVDLRR
jgi:gliding motility-associated-like protein